MHTGADGAHAVRMDIDPWPLWRLTIRTPRLELRPDDDAGMVELAEEAARGVHDPAEMPFSVPWTDAPTDEMVLSLVRHYWQQRTEHTPDSWKLNVLVRRDGRVIGTQNVRAEDFATLREIHTGSWIGQRHQGQGLGTEMRAAILLFVFDHLAARQARSEAFVDNNRSRRVSEKLGYAPDGSTRRRRRGECGELARFLVTRESFARPDWNVAVTGLPACESLLLGS